MQLLPAPSQDFTTTATRDTDSMRALHACAPGAPFLYPCSHSLLTFLHRGVGIGQEAKVSFVVPADQRHVALCPDLVLAPGKWGSRVGQHGWRETCAVALPGAEEAAAVDPWKERCKLSHVPLSVPTHNPGRRAEPSEAVVEAFPHPSIRAHPKATEAITNASDRLMQQYGPYQLNGALGWHCGA